MDISKNIGDNLPLVIGAVALVFFQYVLRRRRGPAGNQNDIVQDLLGEVKLDIRLAELFAVKWQTKKFMTTTWQLNKDKLDFLDKAAQVSISDAFVMAEDFNQRMEAARKSRSNADMAGADMGKLQELLVVCREALEQWLLLKVGSKNPPLKARSMFDNLLGRR